MKALSNASFTVSAGVRASSFTTGFPSGVSVVTVNYENSQSLLQVFKDQDAIIEAFNPNVAIHQEKIIQAALQAGVQHIITPDFSSDTFNPNVTELMIFEPKLEAQAVLEDVAHSTKLKWTAVITGPFFDWGLFLLIALAFNITNQNTAIPRGIFWVNPEQKTVTIIGSGNQQVSMSALDIVGRATVAILKNPSAYANRPAYFADYTISSNDLLALLNDIVGSDEWKATQVPLDGFLSKAKEMWAEDTKNGVKDRLNSSAYQMLGTYGVFDEGNRYEADFSGKVEGGFGVPKVDFMEALRKATRCNNE